jgi:hypothetical protein
MHNENELLNDLLNRNGGRNMHKEDELLNDLLNRCRESEDHENSMLYDLRTRTARPSKPDDDPDHVIAIKPRDVEFGGRFKRP